MSNCDSSCGCTTLCNVVEDLLVSTDQGLRCRASLDSVRSRNAYAQSQRSKGVLLHSAATAQSTMDYSTMAVDDGVVESPLCHGRIPVRSTTPSPIWPSNVEVSPTAVRREGVSAKRTLYSGSKHPASAKSFEVGFSMQFRRISVICFLLSFMLAGIVVLKLCLSVTMLYFGYLALVELNTSGDYLALFELNT